MTSKPEMFTNAQVRLLETIARGLGARDKEEAIIYLLEKQLCGNPDCSNSYGHNTCQLWQDAIALIKGEK